MEGRPGDDDGGAVMGEGEEDEGFHPPPPFPGNWVHAIYQDCAILSFLDGYVGTKCPPFLPHTAVVVTK